MKHPRCSLSSTSQHDLWRIIPWVSTTEISRLRVLNESKNIEDARCRDISHLSWFACEKMIENVTGRLAQIRQRNNCHSHIRSKECHWVYSSKTIATYFLELILAIYVLSGCLSVYALSCFCPLPSCSTLQLSGRFFYHWWFIVQPPPEPHWIMDW